MNIWTVQDAKARFSELLNSCIQKGSQLVTRRGEKIAVLIPFTEWNHWDKESRKSFKDLLLSEENRFNIDLPQRGAAKRRSVLKL